MPKQRPALTTIGAMRHLRDTWRRELAERPVAARLGAVGAIMVVVGAGLTATQLDLLGQLIAGLALLPLSLAVFLRLLPAPPWTDDADDGWGPGRGRDDPCIPRSPSDPGLNIDWELFEQQFHTYAAQREPPRPTPQ